MKNTQDKGRPEAGKIYALTGATGTPAISNGNTWAESEVGGEADVTAKIKARVEKYVALVQSLQPLKGDVNHVEVSAMYGKKYARIVTTRNGGGRSVHSFINLANGDILKSATWATPAKHARGNILAEDIGASAINQYGANYLN